jgi:hypothetical protein
MEPFLKFLKFVIWAVSAIFILPCVFIAGVIYPKWEKWGEDF